MDQRLVLIELFIKFNQLLDIAMECEEGYKFRPDQEKAINESMREFVESLSVALKGVSNG